MDKNTKKTTPWIEGHDLWAAFSLLTRLPVPVDHDRAGARAAQAIWAYPLVGAVVSALGVGIVFGLWGLGVPPLAAALCGLMGTILITGALHEDGLADCADGLMGGATAERRLEIMRDSQVGSYGALALVCSVGLRAVCLASLVPQGLWGAIVVGALSRGALVAVAVGVRDARDSGLGAGFGRPSGPALGLCAGLCVLAALGLGPLSALAVLLAGGTAAAALALCAQRLIGGRTGDVLGGTQQMFEMAGLLALTALWS
ncbi:MAG: adenosylcobinamide-GDP ribazoletransferase [Pseudomonadota bacterium]